MRRFEKLLVPGIVIALLGILAVVTVFGGLFNAADYGDNMFAQTVLIELFGENIPLRRPTNLSHTLVFGGCALVAIGAVAACAGGYARVRND